MFGCGAAGQACLTKDIEKDFCKRTVKQVFMNVAVINPLTLKSHIFENSKYSIKRDVMKDAVLGSL